MRIKVKLFAALVPYVPGAKPGTPLEVELKDGSRLSDLINQLKLPQKEMKITFVNAQARPLDYRLKNNDEVGIFPPVGGG
jgi:sulfur-carrier protein